MTRPKPKPDPAVLRRELDALDSQIEALIKSANVFRRKLGRSRRVLTRPSPRRILLVEWLQAVRSNPGRTVVQLAGVLDSYPHHSYRALRKLIDGGKVFREGEPFRHYVVEG